MRSVEVWLSNLGKPDIFVGTLREIQPKNYHQPTLDFTYNPAYRSNPGAYALAPDMPLVSGSIILPHDRKMFAGLADSLPDDWGRRIIRRRHSDSCRAGGTTVTPLSELDYLLNQSDETRVGALRFKVSGSTEYSQPGVGSVNDIERLIQAALRFDEDDATAEDLKLDIEAWEAVALDIAFDAKMNVPRHLLKRATASVSRLHLDRFDRVAGGRVGYQSMRSALGYGLDIERTFSYQEMAEYVAISCDEPNRQLDQLFRKAALSIAINDIDDHTRNLGFVRTNRGWVLAPFFDINPGHPDSAEQSNTWVTRTANRFAKHDFTALIDDSASYRLTSNQALEIIDEIRSAASSWHERAISHGISERSIERYRTSFI
jgi:serine/threonine-protein kinase HipA